MEIQGSVVNFAKRIVQLEAQCNQLQDKNIRLKEELMEMKGKEERTKEQHLKVKDKYVKLKGKYHSEERKWREEEDKIREEYRLLVVEKRKLEIDLKIAERGKGDGCEDVAKKLKAAVAEGLKSLLEEKDGMFTTLLAKSEILETPNSSLEMDFLAKMAMEAKRWKLEEEGKGLELAQEIQVLKDKSNEAEKMAMDVAKKLKAGEAEAEDLKSLYTTLLAKNENLEPKRQKLEEKILELTQKIRVLEAECCKVKEDNNEAKKMTMDVAKKLKAAEAEGLKSLLEEKDGMFTTLLAKNEALETQSNKLEMVFQAEMVMEANRQKLEEEKILGQDGHGASGSQLVMLIMPTLQS